MNKSHREHESREHSKGGKPHHLKEPTNHMSGRSSGGSHKGPNDALVGEIVRQGHSYDHDGTKAVDNMLDGRHPITNLGTVSAGRGMANMEVMSDGGHAKKHKMPKKEHHGHKKHMAMGGAGKVRKGEY